MSFWSRNSDLLDQVAAEALPSPYKEQVEQGEIDLFEVPENVYFKAMNDGIADWLSGVIDRGE